MKINFPVLDEPILINRSTCLVIEDVQVFAKVVQLFYQYEGEGDLKLFDDKQRAVKPAELMIVIDVLGFEINSAATLKLIYADLEEQLNENLEIKGKIESLVANIGDLLAEELIEQELDLQSGELTILDLFKVFNIRIETRSDTIFEKVLEIIQVFKYLVKKKLLVLINVSTFLTQQERLELEKQISLQEIDVLFLEPRKVSGIKQLVLDKDYFLLEENMI